MNKKSKMKRLRLDCGMSQNQLARKADLDRGTISAAENGKSVSDLTKSRIRTALSGELGKDLSEEDLW